MHRPMVRTLIAVIACAWLAACSGSTASAPPASAPGSVAPSTPASNAAVATPSASPARTPGPGDVVYSGQIDVGGGRQLQVQCFGVGAPAILLEGGGITPSLYDWPREFIDKLAQTTTTCAYSRAGGGTSSAPAGTRTMAGLIDDAFAMLAALKDQAGVPGPYVLAGWSFGGEVALAEALAHPDLVTGLVILDTDFIVDFMPTCVASGRTKADCQQEYDDDIDAKSLETEIVKAIRPLPETPLRIVSAMQFPECDPANPDSLRVSIGGKDVKAKDCPDLAKQIAALQLKGWSTINPKLKQMMVPADHDGLIRDAGDQIAPIVLDLVAGARTSS